MRMATGFYWKESFGTTLLSASLPQIVLPMAMAPNTDVINAIERRDFLDGGQ